MMLALTPIFLLGLKRTPIYPSSYASSTLLTIDKRNSIFHIHLHNGHRESTSTVDHPWINGRSMVDQQWINGRSMVHQRWINGRSTVDQRWLMRIIVAGIVHIRGRARLGQRHVSYEAIIRPARTPDRALRTFRIMHSPVRTSVVAYAHIQLLSMYELPIDGLHAAWQRIERRCERCTL